MGLKNILKKIGRLSLPALIPLIMSFSPVKSNAETFSVVCGGHDSLKYNVGISSSAIVLYHVLKITQPEEQNHNLMINKVGTDTIKAVRARSWSGDDDWEYQNLLNFPTVAQIDYQDNDITATNFLNAIKNTPTTNKDNLIISFISHSSAENTGYFDLFTGGAGGSTWEGIPLDGRNLKAYMLNKALKDKTFSKCYVIGTGCHGNSTLKNLDKDKDLVSSPLENVIAISSTNDAEVESGIYFPHYLAHLIRNNPTGTVSELLRQADSLNDPENMVVHYFGSDPQKLQDWCDNHSFFDVDSSVAVEEKPRMTLDNYVKASPNPFNGSVILSYDRNKFPDARVYSIDGKLIEVLKDNKFTPKNAPAGIYLAVFRGKDKKVVKKLNYLK